MKKLALSLAALSLSVTALFASSDFEKKGFLTTKACAEKGAFTDCSLDSFSCNTQGCFAKTEPGVETKVDLVLFVHDEGKYYHVDPSKVKRSELDEGVSKNEVSITGEFNSKTNTIIVHEFKAPPPAAKSFFKGCL